jgi:ribosomal protein S18 acetylase RimI-like enzyme
MKISLQIAQQDAASEVAALVIQLLMELDGDPADAFDLDEYTGTAQRLIEQNKVTAILAYVDGQVVGVLTLNACAAIYNGGDFGEICELYVKPEWRSSKVGSALVNEAVAIAKQKQWQRIEVGAPPVGQWDRSIAFYKTYGFTEIGPRLGFSVK